MHIPRSTVLTLTLSLAALAAAYGSESPEAPRWTDVRTPARSSELHNLVMREGGTPYLAFGARGGGS